MRDVDSLLNLLVNIDRHSLGHDSRLRGRSGPTVGKLCATTHRLADATGWRKKQPPASQPDGGFLGQGRYC